MATKKYRLHHPGPKRPQTQIFSKLQYSIQIYLFAFNY